MREWIRSVFDNHSTCYPFVLPGGIRELLSRNPHLSSYLRPQGFSALSVPFSFLLSFLQWTRESRRDIDSLRAHALHSLVQITPIMYDAHFLSRGGQQPTVAVILRFSGQPFFAEYSLPITPSSTLSYFLPEPKKHKEFPVCCNELNSLLLIS